MALRKNITPLGRIFRMVFGYLPIAVVALAWIGLWFIWPSDNAAAGGEVRHVSNADYVYTGLSGKDVPPWKRPDAFADTRLTGISVPEPVEKFELSPIQSQPSVPRYMQHSASKDGGMTGTEVDFNAEFRPVLPVNPVFKSAGVVKPGITVIVSERLKTAGFDVPRLKLDPEQNKLSWQIVLSVSLDKTGLVKDVFIEQGTGSRQLDDSIVSQVYAVKTGNASGPVTGSITINRSR